MSSDPSNVGSPSVAPAASPAVAPVTPLTSKLNTKAPAFNPNAKSFTPSTPATPAATKPLNPNTPTFRPTAPAFVPNGGAPAFIPGGSPAFPQQQMRQPYPMQPQQHMMMQQPFYPSPYMQPQFYPPPQFMMNGMGMMQPPMGMMMPQMPHQLQQQQPRPVIQSQPQPQASVPSKPSVAPTANAPLLASPNLAPAQTPAAAPAATPAAAPVAQTQTPAKKDAPVAATTAAATPAPAAAAAPKAATPTPAASATAAPAPAPVADKPAEPKTAASIVAAASADKSGSAAAQSFGVKPVAPYKPKPVSERERKPKKAEDDEQDLKDARARANSNVEEEAAPAAAATAAAAKPAPVSAPTATTPTAAASVTSPGSRKQTMADAESSLEAAITATTGALQYNRDYLLQFQPLNMTPPENLINSIEAILKGNDSGSSFDPRGGLQPGNKLRPGQTTGRSRVLGATPAVPHSGAPARAGFGTAAQAPRANTGNNRPQGNGRGRPRADQPMDIEIKPLEVTENGYKRLENIPADAQVIRSLNAILNKLTPEKFDILVEQVLELNITTAALLRDVVTTVFEKALAEPNYAPVYAEFSVKLSAKLQSFPADETDTQNTHNFKRLVLNQCQLEFESGEDKSETGSDPAEEFAARKKRMISTIRFIGELFVRAMLAGRIMKNCIVLLVGNTDTPSEENIEALCKLLETVGKLMDNKANAANHAFMNNVFAELEILAMPPSKENREKTEAGKPVLSSRLRFMIQDTLDLRRKDWVLRRKNEVNAKKISDVHKEAAAPPPQDARSNPAARPPAALSVSRFAKKQDRYAVGPSSPSPRGAKPDDGWETAKSGKRSQDVRGNTSMTRQNSGSSSSAANTPSNRAGPPTPAKAPFRPSEKSEKKEDGKNNAFALLHAAGEEEEDGDARSPHRDDGDADEDQLDDEESDIPQLSEEQIADKTKSFLSDYFRSDDFAEVELSIKELGGRSVLSAKTVEDAILLVLEGNDNSRKALAKLLPLLAKEKYLTADQIEGGMFTILDLSDDLGVDYPRLIEQVSAIIAQLIFESVFDLSTLQRLSKPVKGDGDQVKLATFVLSNLKKSHEAAGSDFVAFVTESGLKWNDIAGDNLNAEQAKKHMTDKKLEMLTSVLL